MLAPRNLLLACASTMARTSPARVASIGALRFAASTSKPAPKAAAASKAPTPNAAAEAVARAPSAKRPVATGNKSAIANPKSTENNAQPPEPARVWKRRPGTKISDNIMMMENTVAEMDKNLQHLISLKTTQPPRVGALHRILERVSSEEEFATARRSINRSATAKLRFNDRTTLLVAHAAIKAGVPGKALGVFSDSEVGMPINSGAAAALFRAAATKGDADLLARTYELSRVQHVQPSAGFVKAGNVAALKVGNYRLAVQLVQLMKAKDSMAFSQPLFKLLQILVGDGSPAAITAVLAKLRSSDLTFLEQSIKAVLALPAPAQPSLYSTKLNRFANTLQPLIQAAKEAKPAAAPAAPAAAGTNDAAPAPAVDAKAAPAAKPAAKA